MGHTQPELELIAIWTDVLEGSEYPWVLFQFGTCIILRDPKEDLRQQAVDMMAQWAIPISGTPSNKYNISFLTDQGIPGCLVGCHHPDIITYVAPEEAPHHKGNNYDYVGVRINVGTFGKKKRQWDCETVKIIHVEDKRSES